MRYVMHFGDKSDVLVLEGTNGSGEVVGYSIRVAEKRVAYPDKLHKLFLDLAPAMLMREGEEESPEVREAKKTARERLEECYAPIDSKHAGAMYNVANYDELIALLKHLRSEGVLVPIPEE